MVSQFSIDSNRSASFLRRSTLLWAGLLVICVSLFFVNPFSILNFGKNNSANTLFSPSLTATSEPVKAAMNRFDAQLHFVPNQGQYSSEETQFIVQGLAYQIAMQSSQVSMALPVGSESSVAVVNMHFVGGNKQPNIVGQDQQVTRYNYYIGSNAQDWQTDIPSYAKVHYQSVYPNIDAVFYGTEGQLEYDFIVQPGGNVDDIQLDFSGVERMQLDAQGNLLMHVAGQTLTQSKPYTYQIIGNKTIEVDSHFVLDAVSASVRFEVATFDKKYPLNIDPTVLFSNYLGGSGKDFVHDVAVDSSGNVYVTGLTRSNDFLTAGTTFTSSRSTNRVFVEKFAANGGNLLSSTIFSGTNGDDVGNAISVGDDGMLYVTGETRSFPSGSPNGAAGDFPTTSDALTSNPSTTVPDIFVLRLDPVNLNMKYGTYFGGSSADRGTDIVADANGQMYVSVITKSTDFIPTGVSAPSLAPYQATFSGQNTSENAGFFVLSTDGATTTNIYTTYLGGTGRDFATGIALGANGEVFVAGTTDSSDFNSTANALFTSNRTAATQPNGLNGIGSVTGNEDGFLGKFDITKPAAASALFVTYLGGDSTDEILGMDIDAAGNVYLVGSTFSTDATFLVAAANTTPANTLTHFEAFYAKLGNDVNGNFAVLNKQIITGSPSTDVAWDVAVDDAGTTAYVIGETQPLGATVFTTTDPLAGQTTAQGNIDVFLAEFDAATGTLNSSSLFGGSGHDSAFAFPLNGIRSGFGIDVSPSGALLYLAGSTQSTNFPHTTTGQPTNPITAEQNNPNSANAPQNGFLIGIGPIVNLSLTDTTVATTSPIQGDPIPFSLTITNNSNAEIARNVVLTNDLTLGTGSPVLTYVSDTPNSVCTVSADKKQLVCAIGDIPPNTTKDIMVNLIAANAGPLINQVSVVAVGSPSPITLTFASINVDSTADLAVSMMASPASPAAVALNGNVTYTINVLNNGPSTAQGIRFTDTLPATTNLVSVTTPLGRCTAADVNGNSPCGCSLILSNNLLNCPLPLLNNGGIHPITLVAQATTVGSISNTATVAAQTSENINTTGDNSVNVTSSVALGADIRLTSQGAVQEATSLKVSRQTTPGRPFVYTFQVENIGSADISGAVVNMSIPQGSAATVPLANISWTCTVITGSSTCLGANSGAGNIINETVILPVNGKIEYTMTVAPTNPADRGSLTADITVAMPTSLADLSPSNNNLTFVDVLNPVTNLIITKKDRLDTVLNTTPSNPTTITYDIKVTNSGPSQATGVNVIDTLPSSVSYISSTPACSGPNTNVLTCDIGVLDVGVTTSFEVVVSSPTLAGQTVSNIAKVTSIENTTGATVAETTQIVDAASAAADISMTMTAVDASNDGVFSIGEAITYNVVVANAGPFDATNVSVTFTFPNASLFSNITGFTCTAVTTDEIKCDIGTIAINGSVTASASYTLPNITGVIDVNAKAASATFGDPQPTNNFANLQMNVVTAVQVLGSSNAGGGSSGPFFLMGLLFMVILRRISAVTSVRKLFNLGLLLSFLGLSSVASATMDKRFYLQASYGQSSFASFSAADVSNRVQADGFSVTSVQMDNSRAGKEYLLGYQFKPNWAAELSYIDLDNVRVVPQGNTSNIDGFLNSVLNSIPSKSRGVLIDIMGKRHIASQIDVYGRAGLFFWKSDIEVHATTLVGGTTTTKSVSRSDRGADIFFAAGTAFNITDQWALLIEWKGILGDEIVNFVSGGVRYTLPIFQM